MRLLVGFVCLMCLATFGCGGGSDQNNVIRTFTLSDSGVQTGQSSTTISRGSSSAGMTISWASPFASTDYTVVCTPKVVSGSADGLSTLITSKSTTGVQVAIQSGSTATVDVNCLAVGDSAVGDLLHARGSFSSAGVTQPSLQSLTWSTAFTDSNYTPVCSVIAAASSMPASEHISAATPTQLTAWVSVASSSLQSYEVDCIGVPDATTSGVRHAHDKLIVLTSPVGASLNWDTPFADLNYAAVCDTLFVSGSEGEITTSTGASTLNSQSVLVNWQTNDGRAVVGCIAAVPGAGSGVTTPTRG